MYPLTWCAGASVSCRRTSSRRFSRWLSCNHGHILLAANKEGASSSSGGVKDSPTLVSAALHAPQLASDSGSAILPPSHNRQVVLERSAANALEVDASAAAAEGALYWWAVTSVRGTPGCVAGAAAHRSRRTTRSQRSNKRVRLNFSRTCLAARDKTRADRVLGSMLQLLSIMNATAFDVCFDMIMGGTTSTRCKSALPRAGAL